MKVAVTGGAGFIGSAVVRHLVNDRDAEVLTIDKLTYAGNLENLAEVEQAQSHRFSRTDVCDMGALRTQILDFEPDAIVHLAAESHVDRSIDGPGAFIGTNIVGTYNILEVARELHPIVGNLRVLHVSTDEVYGSLGPAGAFSETSPYRPRSPYSASKAASDHIARAWFETYDLPVIVTNCSNNYGPYQFPEKLIPLTILNAIAGRPLAIYGDGLQVRDWLHVDDHVAGLMSVLDAGQVGQTYNIGAACEQTNVAVVDAVLAEVARQTDCDLELLSRLKRHVPDRPAHDRRYAIDATKIRSELKWAPRHSFASGLRKTVAWYLANQGWCEHASSKYRGDRLGLRSA